MLIGKFLEYFLKHRLIRAYHFLVNNESLCMLTIFDVDNAIFVTVVDTDYCPCILVSLTYGIE